MDSALRSCTSASALGGKNEIAEWIIWTPGDVEAVSIALFDESVSPAGTACKETPSSRARVPHWIVLREAVRIGWCTPSGRQMQSVRLNIGRRGR